jgi:hypothetical protein
MNPKARKVHLEMFETNELLTELMRRTNIAIVIGVVFLDGTNGADPETVFCCGRWDAEEGLAITEVLHEYAKEIEDEETPTEESRDGDSSED